MRYRIKIVTYANGRKEYCPQYRVKVGWANLMYDGGWDLVVKHTYSSREEALKPIDKHYAGNTRKQFIEFEYINKP